MVTTIERPWTASEVAQLFSVSLATVNLKARTSQWPARKIGRSWLFTRNDLDQIMGSVEKVGDDK